METTTDFNKQAQDFLTKNGVKFSAKYLDYAPYFDDDNVSRAIYSLTLRVNGKSASFKFGQSIKSTEKGEEPSAYELLASLTKSDPGTFEEFCGEFGYDTDSRKAYKTYSAVVREWCKVNRLFTEAQILELQEIT